MSVTFYRDQLKSRQAREYYDRILSAVSGEEPAAHIPLPVSDGADGSEDAFAAWRAVKKDRTELFFIGRNAQTQTRDGQFFLDITLLYSSEEIRKMRVCMDRRLRHLTFGVMHLPLWEREKVVYERVKRMIIYKDHGKEYDHSIAGPLMQGSGVCEGFSHLMIQALRRVGIPCIYVHGKGIEDGGNHGWNMVWLGDRSYHLDVTWEAAYEDGEVGFHYFNLTDEQICRDHIIETEGLPRCEDPTGGYYSRVGTLFTSPEEMAAYLKEAFAKSRDAQRVRLEGPYDIQKCLAGALNGLPGQYRYQWFEKQRTAMIWKIKDET